MHYFNLCLQIRQTTSTRPLWATPQHIPILSHRCCDLPHFCDPSNSFYSVLLYKKVLLQKEII